MRTCLRTFERFRRGELSRGRGLQGRLTDALTAASPAAAGLASTPMAYSQAACDPRYSPRYAARTFGSSSSCLASPLIVTSPDSMT